MTPDPIIKICGITRLSDARHAVKHGAGALGFVFWPQSPRYIAPEHAAEIIAVLPPDVAAVDDFPDGYGGSRAAGWTRGNRRLAAGGGRRSRPSGRAGRRPHARQRG